MICPLLQVVYPSAQWTSQTQKESASSQKPLLHGVAAPDGDRGTGACGFDGQRHVGVGLGHGRV